LTDKPVMDVLGEQGPRTAIFDIEVYGERQKRGRMQGPL
jgi:hypothetical protein